MRIRMMPLTTGLILAALLCAAPGMAKQQYQGQQGGVQQQATPYGNPAQVGIQGQQVSPQRAQPSINTQGNRTTPYGPPSYAGPKGSQTPPYGPPSYSGHKQKYNNQGMPPGQQKKAYKHSKKSHRNGPPDHAPAWKTPAASAIRVRQAAGRLSP